jgi:hypothetical protein
MADLNRHAAKAVAGSLEPGETIEVVIAGPSNQAVVGTNRRAFIYKKGFMAGATLGSELTSWDYRNLAGVQIHTGMMNGAVVLQAPGQAGVSTNVWKNKDSDPYKAPNAIPIVRPFDDAQAGVAKLRKLVAAHHSAQAPASPAAPAGSVADEIRQLADLRAGGALSEEEFADLKAALIRRMQTE